MMKYQFITCLVFYITFCITLQTARSSDSCKGKQEWVTAGAGPYDGYMPFLAGEWWKVDCRLNNSDNNVTLWRRPLYTRSPVQRIGPEKLNETEIKHVFIMWMSLSDSGRYYCGACAMTKYIGGVRMMTGPAFAKPFLSTKPKINAFKFGSNMTLECSVKGSYGSYQMDWFKVDSTGMNTLLKSRDTSIWTSGSVVQRQTLLFPNLGKKDQGTYMCQLHRFAVMYTARKNITLRLNGIVYPKIRNFPGEHNFVEERGNLSFRYNVSGWPQPNITWHRRKNGIEKKIAWFTTDSHYSELSGITNNTFSIGTLTYEKDHNVTYVCHVANEFGSASQSIVVLIRTKPRIIAPSEKGGKIQIYKKGMTLPCVLTHSSYPGMVHFTWQIYESTEYTQLETSQQCPGWKTVRHELSSFESKLKVPNPNTTFALYRCQVSNEVGEDDDSWIIVKPEYAKRLYCVEDKWGDVLPTIWQVIVIVLGGLILLALVLSQLSKRKERKRREVLATKLIMVQGTGV